MELALKWKGYGFSIIILTGKAESTPECKEERMVQSHSAQEHREAAERDHLLACGSRYVGPIR